MERQHQAVDLVTYRDSSLPSSLPSADVRRICLETNPKSSDIEIKLQIGTYNCHRLVDSGARISLLN